MPLKKIRQLYREADAILNVCGTQEFNDDLLVCDRILYIESDPGVEQIKIDKACEVDNRISATASRAFHLWRKHRDERFSRAAAWIQMAAHTTTSRDRSLENEAFAVSRRRVYTSIAELVHQRSERHHVARRKISLEQIARISPVRRRAEKSRRTIRAGDRHRGFEKTREKFRAKRLAPDFAAANERRLLALPRLHPALQRRVHRREGSIRPARHRLVQRPQRVLSRCRPPCHHSGNRLHQKLRRQRWTLVISNAWTKSPMP